MSIHCAIEPAAERDLMARLADGIAAKMVPVFADVHAEIRKFARTGGTRRDDRGSAQDHARCVMDYVFAQLQTIDRFQAAERDFQSRMANALDETAHRNAVIDFARALGADARRLRRDRKAFAAWFDADAVLERCHKRIGERERALAHAVERLGPIMADAVISDPLGLNPALLNEWATKVWTPTLGWRGDPRVREAAYRSLATIAPNVARWPFGTLFDNILSQVRRTCLDLGSPVWVQCAAIDALMQLSPASLAAVVNQRLRHDDGDDGLFLRRHMVRLLAGHSERHAEFPALLSQLAIDGNGAVRQAASDVVHLLPAPAALPLIEASKRDPDPQVRAAMFADVERLLKVCPAHVLAVHLNALLRLEEDEFVLRVALDAAGGLAARVPEASRDAVCRRLRGAIDALHARHVSPRIDRWADEARERVWLQADRFAMRIGHAIHSASATRQEARVYPIPALAAMPDEQRMTVGRAMAVLAQGNYGLSVKLGRRPTIQRGEMIRRRLWRILFEGRHSATDKRQAHVHTTGRHYHGTMLAPSSRMSELAPTKVPGEPLFEAREGGWRNYLPLVDQVLHALDRGRAIEVFTSAGLTTIVPPARLISRAAVFLRISHRFVELAELRNRDPAAFVASLRRHGCEVTFARYDGAPPAPAIEAMFA